MYSIESHKAGISAEMSSKVQAAYDKVRIDIPDSDLDAARTAAEIIVTVDELKLRKAGELLEKRALARRRHDARASYMRSHPEVEGRDKITIGFMFFCSDAPEALSMLLPSELLAMYAEKGGAAS